jgi:hypothetical protein
LTAVGVLLSVERRRATITLGGRSEHAPSRLGRITKKGNGGLVMLGTTPSMEAPIASLLLVIAIASGKLGVVPGTKPADEPS